MSSITHMVIYARGIDHEAMARLNSWCAERGDSPGQRFGRLDVGAAGGPKFFTSQVWAMAGNHFPYEALVKALPTFDWKSPEDVVLLVDDENGDGTEVHRVTSPSAPPGLR